VVAGVGGLRPSGLAASAGLAASSGFLA